VNLEEGQSKDKRGRGRVIGSSAVVFMVLGYALLSDMEVQAGDGIPKATTLFELKAEPSKETASTKGEAAKGGALEITIEDAILLTLKNNQSLKVEQFTIPITRSFEDQERAVFDPTLNAMGEYSREKGVTQSALASGFFEDTENDALATVGISKFFSTGTQVSVSASGERTWSDFYSDKYASRLGFSVTQALLRGAGTAVNLASLQQAQITTRISEYEFRGFAQDLVAQVEDTYWDYALARRQIMIFEESLKVAEQQLSDIKEMISVGRLAETEVVAAQAEIAVQRQGLIAAQGTMETTRLRFLKLLNPQGHGLWDRGVVLTQKPILPEAMLDPVKAHVNIALRWRPDLNQAKLGVQRNDLEIVKTKNGLLPKMDFFITLGKTGYADSFGSSVSHITGDHYDVLAGVTFQYPIRNRDAKARYQRSILVKGQALEAIGNLEQLVELEVRSAYIDVANAREQISASTASRKLQEEKLRIETERVKVGRSTTFLVSQAQRDLLSSQIAEVQAVANYLKALVALYRLEGSLLERHGIAAPGRDAVTLAP
jgi:outer membrane protein